MSVTFDVFIKFRGPKQSLSKELTNKLGIVLEGKDPWLFGHIELYLENRAEDPRYFRGRQFRPYNFVLSGTTYAATHQWGDLSEVPIMDVIAQYTAGFLRTRTMIHCDITGEARRYSSANAKQRKKGWLVIDEKTKRPPEGFYT